MIEFFVPGIPRPKQSFRYTKNGGGFTDHRMKEWQNTVILFTRNFMQNNDIQQIHGKIAIDLCFILPDNRTRDLDNLSKGVLDALKNEIIDDDTNVIDLHLRKFVHPQTGVYITITPLE